jgi:hypothetical protein
VKDFNKLHVASQVLMEAHRRYVSATEDIDYFVSILLSGAVDGIVAPLLKEQGGLTSHSLWARISDVVEPGEKDTHEGLFRENYNALKHAGGDRRKIKPSSDLTFQFDPKREAESSLYAAKQDFRQLRPEISPEVMMQWSQEFIDLLDSDDGYDAGAVEE